MRGMLSDKGETGEAGGTRWNDKRKTRRDSALPESLVHTQTHTQSGIYEDRQRP